MKTTTNNIPKDIWGSNFDEDILTTGNDTDDDYNFYQLDIDYPEEEVSDLRMLTNLKYKKYKNVRFQNGCGGGGSTDFNNYFDTSEGSSLENDFTEFNANDYAQRQRHRYSQNNQEHSGKLIMNEQLKNFYKQNRRILMDQSMEKKKYEKRSQKNNNNSDKLSSFYEGPAAVGAVGGGGGNHRPVDLTQFDDVIGKQKTKKLEQQRFKRIMMKDGGGILDQNCNDMIIDKKQICKYDQDFDLRQQQQQHHRHNNGDCYEYHHHHQTNDDGRKKILNKTHKQQNYKNQQRDSRIFNYNNNNISKDCFTYDLSQNDYKNHLKCGKRKTLEAVEEQQEQLSDSTYELLCPKFSSHTMPDDLLEYKNNEKIRINNDDKSMNHTYWTSCRKNFGDNKMIRTQRLHKMRSRRTRLNRLKNGWKKAFVHTGEIFYFFFLNDKQTLKMFVRLFFIVSQRWKS